MLENRRGETGNEGNAQANTLLLNRHGTIQGLKKVRKGGGEGGREEEEGGRGEKGEGEGEEEEEGGGGGEREGEGEEGNSCLKLVKVLPRLV